MLSFAPCFLLITSDTVSVTILSLRFLFLYCQSEILHFAFSLRICLCYLFFAAIRDQNPGKSNFYNDYSFHYCMT